MRVVKVKLFVIAFILLLFPLGYLIVEYYSIVFSRTVTGKVVAIDRVTQPNTLIGNGGQIPASQIFSFAIAIRDTQGEIITSSSEDRQWAVVEKDQCASAKFFPYPPWQFEKAGTFYGARLLKIFDCPEKQ
jgi:hypothetical protein